MSNIMVRNYNLFLIKICKFPAQHRVYMGDICMFKGGKSRNLGCSLSDSHRFSATGLYSDLYSAATPVPHAD